MNGTHPPLISFLIPVKKVETRPPMLLDCVSSIFENAYSRDNVELLIGIDVDDEVTTEYVKECISDYQDCNITLYFRPPALNFIQNFYEVGYGKSKGDLIWCIGEDVEILTKHYDKKIKSRLEIEKGKECPYIVVGGEGINGLPDGRNQYCNFPLVSKNFVHKGTFFPTKINSWGVDAYFALVFHWFEQIGLNQTVDMKGEIELRHRSHHLGDFEKDELYAKQDERDQEGSPFAIMEEVNTTIEHFYLQIVVHKNNVV